jgi:HKD family nuclease
MEIKFIGQGFNLEASTCVADALITAFEDEIYNTFKCLVAFASHTGISGLKDSVISSKSHIETFKVIIGIDQQGTSKEALESLLEWEVNAFIFNAKQQNIFHPKIYIFEGTNDILIIIGSNNFTKLGLIQNIEGAVEFKLKKDKDTDINLLKQIEDYFNPLLTGDSPYLRTLTKDLIKQLEERGFILSEKAKRAQYAKSETPEEKTDDESLFPTIKLQGIPTKFKPYKISSEPDLIETDIDTVEGLVKETFVKIGNDNWDFTDTSSLLIAEIGGPSRWKQISFAKENFETFFNLPTTVGSNGQINLRYLDSDGVLEDEIEECISARVKASSNYNLEPLKVRESKLEYDIHNRPIILFIKINSTNFIYHFEEPGSPEYAEMHAFLEDADGGIKRKVTRLSILKKKCPILTS